MRINKHVGMALGACAMAAGILATPLLAEDQSANKFDAAIKMAMASSNGAQRLSAMTCAKGEQGFADGVRVLVKTSDRGAQVSSYLSKRGGRINSRHGNIVSLILPYEALKGLAKLDSVSYIEASRSLCSTNNLAASNKKGTHLEAMLSTCPSYTGKGVVVGVIDTGIDTTLDAFKNEEGKSRISYFWNMEINDQTRYPTVVTPEGESHTYSYGSEYTAADIDKQKAKSPVFTDPGGHGTHVCGTIGGRDTKYPGMAPEVQYIVVDNTTVNDEGSEDMWSGAGSGSTLDAIEYIISRAEEMNMPLVVNISQGTCIGPHDGSTLFEQAIQADIEERNLIICLSAGNENSKQKTAEVTVPAGGSETVKLTMAVYPDMWDYTYYNSVDIWSKGNPKIDMNVACTDVSRDIAYEETIDEYEDFGDLKMSCSKELSCVLNGDDRCLLNFHATSDVSNNKPQLQIVFLTFTNNSSEDADISLYLQRNTKSEFLDHVGGCTIGMPGSTPGAITVGAFWSRAEGSSATDGEICSFSAQGPVRKPDLYSGLNAVKPDIVAPGAFLYSMASTGSNANAPYIAMAGTSMSTPVVAGTVALILQNMPDATPEQIKEILFDEAMSDDFTGEVPNDVYGRGKLSAKSLESAKIVSPKPNAVEAVRSKDKKKNLIITGTGFTPAVDVYINGILWEADKVVVDGSTQITVKDVFAKKSPLMEDGAVTIQTVKVVNRLGKAGANSSELSIGTDTSEDIAKLSSGSGGCFIATAAYGSYLEPEVMTLRRFRDRSLITNAPGRAFVKLYYTYSPPAAAYIAEHPCARWAARAALTPVVYSVSHPGTALALALLLGVTGGAVYRRRKLEKAG